MDGELIVERERKGTSEPSVPTRRPLPWLITSLIILCWALFVYSLYKNNCPSKPPPDACILYGTLGRFSFQPLPENRQFGPEGNTLVALGGLDRNFKKKQTMKWHILSSMFFHRGLVSLILDTIGLLYMGMELEKKFGIVKIGSLYLLSSLGGSLWASLKFKGSVYVGGSSGVCGLTGGAFAELFINLNMHHEKFKRFLSLCVGAAINFTITLFRGADVSGHIGGLYFGFLVGFLFLIQPQPESTGFKYKHSGCDPKQLILNYSRYQLVLCVIALICAIIQFLYSLIKFILH